MLCKRKNYLFDMNVVSLLPALIFVLQGFKSLSALPTKTGTVDLLDIEDPATDSEPTPSSTAATRLTVSSVPSSAQPTSSEHQGMTINLDEFSSPLTHNGVDTLYLGSHGFKGDSRLVASMSNTPARAQKSKLVSLVQSLIRSRHFWRSMNLTPDARNKHLTNTFTIQTPKSQSNSPTSVNTNTSASSNYANDTAHAALWRGRKARISRSVRSRARYPLSISPSDLLQFYVRSESVSSQERRSNSRRKALISFIINAQEP